MYDKRLNEQLLRMNARYQELRHSNAFLSNVVKKRYINNIRKMAFGEIKRDLKYRKYSIEHFSTSGNKNYENEEYQDTNNKKIAVYTCIAGNYDNVFEPVYVEPGVDYLIYTDQPVPTDSIWKKRDISKDAQYDGLTPVMMNRKIKIQQCDELMKYDYTVYIDGNIEVVAAVSPMIEQMGKTSIGIHYHRSRDCIYDEAVSVKHLKRIKGEKIDQQLSEYRKEGFPIHYGLYENSIIIRNNKDSSVTELMNSWWEEFKRYPTRDQFSLPYVIWKTKYEKEKIYILGNDIEMNPAFNRIGEHR